LWWLTNWGVMCRTNITYTRSISCSYTLWLNTNSMGIILFTTGPERLWSPPSLLSNGYGSLFPWG
jgi:hypothetical protein